MSNKEFSDGTAVDSSNKADEKQVCPSAANAMLSAAIFEGNQLIASFYGAAYNHVQDYYLIKDFSFMGRIEEMKFNSSWDWLIPVWIKFRHFNTIIQMVLEGMI